MKRLVGGTIAILLTTMIFTGCGSKDDAGSDNSNPNTNESTQSANNTSSSAVRGGQFQRADVMGEVVSVSGSDISLKLLKLLKPQGMGNGQRRNGQNDNGQGAPKDQQGNQTQGDKPNPPDNQGQDNQQNRQGQGGQRNRQGGGFQREYSGETQTVTVPSGVSIEENTFSNGKRETKKIEAKDLKQGDILQVWYSDKDKKTISRIQVMTIPARPQQNGQPNDQQNKQ